MPRLAPARRVALLGAESTGKSMLAAALAAHWQTCHAAEYGRELALARVDTMSERALLRIARTQVAREESLLDRARDVLLCDTTPLTVLMYAQSLYGRAPAELHELADRHYDLVLLCDIDVPFVQDGTRGDVAARQRQHAWYQRELEGRGIAHQRVSGDWPARHATAIAAIGAMPGWTASPTRG